ncbi:MAG: TolC family protein [Bacteroidetes bacterium]|nr:TolC family protein [Bacteroidota bacterium]
MIYYLRMAIFCLFISPVIAQEALILSPESAVKIGLEKNYGIQILRNNERIAALNNTLGRAGFLPNVGFNSLVNYASNNTEQKFFNGEVRAGNGAGNLTTRMGLEVNWTAFDGFNMFVERDRLALMEKMSRTETTGQMQTLAAGILAAYYRLVELERSTENLRYAVSLDRDILDLVKNKKKIGTATGLEVLQSQTRLNSDSARLVLLENDISRSRMNFNILLNLEPNTPFVLDTSFNNALLPSLDELLMRTRQNHPDLLLSKLQKEQAALRLETVKSSFWPVVTLQAAYNMAFSRSEVGFLLSNRSNGPFIGLTLRYNIFDGQNRKHDKEIALVQMENAALRETDLLTILEGRIKTKWSDYAALSGLIAMEQENLNASRQQSALARELYRLGKTTNFEVRESILQEIQALDRVINAQARVKQVEIEIFNDAGIPLFPIQ